MININAEVNSCSFIGQSKAHGCFKEKQTKNCLCFLSVLKSYSVESFNELEGFYFIFWKI